ncbi:MAG: adenylyl-sulfate kinase, partial [Firmicutes bacterium]|nr:adenylyl-sulfate kinase [Bacillota bacterium]
MTTQTRNLTAVTSSVTKDHRRRRNGHHSCAIWLTGLSGAGKSTIANACEQRLHAAGLHTYLLDGDNVRLGLNRDLGFSEGDRQENIRRVAEVAKLFVDAGTVVIVAFISPFARDREQARALLQPGEFLEVFIDCPLSVCKTRDPKGLYARAEQGLIKEFTGVSAPYEAPVNPEVHLHTDRMMLDECVDRIVAAYTAQSDSEREK